MEHPSQSDGGAEVPAPQIQPPAVLGEASAGEKARLRRHFRACRRAGLAAVQEHLRLVVRRRVPEHLPPGRWLGLYWPLGGEPDLALLAPGGLAEGLAGRLALPAVLPAEDACGGAGAGREPQRLVYLPWDGTPPRGRDACGIPAPLLQDGHPPAPLLPSSLGLLLVPALAIDRRGIRLGSGGGWYDRLRADSAWRAVPALAVLPSCCVVERLPCDPWDVPFAGWVDEQGLHPAAGPLAGPDGASWL